MADSSTTSPLDADDPRISEWIDGRLTPAEAVEIERAVAASPELTLLVEDLRTIRVVMRATSSDVPRVDLGDRVMAAIAASNGNEQRVAAVSRMAAPTPTSRRRLPWLGLAGALAAGVLVTIVINLPSDNGREVALAPREAKRLEANGQRGAKPNSREALADDQSVADLEATGRLERDDAPNALGEARLGKSERALAREEQAFDDAPLNDALAAGGASPVPGESFARRSESFYEPKARSAPTIGGGVRGPTPQAAAAPAPSTVAPQSSPAVVAAPADELKESAALDTLSADKGKSASEFRQAAKRAKVDLAGVLVIAITSPSERRALDRLVADSGLQATPEKDHLELVGTVAAVDSFLQELTRVGLVSAVPARRAVEAGKLKDAEKGDEPNTTLILRVVERKGKQPAPAQAGEADKKP